MSHFEAAIAGLGRALASFHPASMPPLSRAHYRREVISWTLIPVAVGAVEGGVTGIIAKYAFAGTVPAATLNLIVALLTSAPAFANITSFIWAAASHGRHKIRAITLLQTATLLFVAMIALAPFNSWGLLVLVAGSIGSRMCWSGVILLRSTVWHGNFPRNARATVAGKFATIQSIVMASVAFGIGMCVEFDPHAIRVIYPAVALIAGIGVFIYAGMRLRGHRALMRAEREGEDQSARSFNPVRWRRIILEDVKYRQYQTCMFIFGTGNLMMTAPLLIMLKDRFHLSEGPSALIVSTIPLLLIPITIPFWSRLLDRVHIIEFRAIHSWAFVSAILTVLIASVFMQTWLLFVVAVIQGIAHGGGVLGWNLGHHDFAPPEKVSQYMGVHVTLTGIRGMAGPMLAVTVYQSLEWWHAGAGVWVFALCLALSLIGAIGFLRLKRRYVRSTA